MPAVPRMCRWVTAAVVFAAFSASTAAASTVRLLDDPDADGSVLEYTAAPGEPNDLAFLGIYNGRAGVQDGFGAVAITPEAPCRRDPADGWPNEPRFANCPADRLMSIRADLGDGADSGVASMATSFPIVMSGGSGP